MAKKASVGAMKAALYIRVSTRWQLDGDSLPMQREELPKYVQYAMGIKDYEIFEDAGYSAKNTDRPAYQQMMSRVRAGEFTHIVVWKLDRISRNLLDFAGMYAELKRLGVIFISKNEQFDTSTAIGEAMLKIILVFAELERNMTSERVSSIMISRAQNGQWNGGKVPFGYSYDKTASTFSINQGEAETVRVIYAQYEKVRSLLRVAQYLNGMGYKTRSGLPWTPTTVSIILKSPFYVGTYRYNYRDETQEVNTVKKEAEWVYIKDHHPAIIDADRQEAIMGILAENDRTQNPQKSCERKNVHIFAGLITCGVCGQGFQASIDRPRKKGGWRPSIYMCSRHRRFNDCPNKYVSDVTLGPFVLNFLSNYIRAQRSFGRTTDLTVLSKKLLRGDYFRGASISQESLEAIHALFRAHRFGDTEYSPVLAAENDGRPSERDVLEKEQQRLERAMQRLKTLYLYSDDAMPEKEYIRENSSLSQLLANVTARIAELDAIAGEQETLSVSDGDFMQQASYLIITEELLSGRFVNYDKVIRILDRRVVKDFINSCIKNFCIFDGKIIKLTLQNGIIVQFLYGDT